MTLKEMVKEKIEENDWKIRDSSTPFIVVHAKEGKDGNIEEVLDITPIENNEQLSFDTFTQIHSDHVFFPAVKDGSELLYRPGQKTRYLTAFAHQDHLFITTDKTAVHYRYDRNKHKNTCLFYQAPYDKVIGPILVNRDYPIFHVCNGKEQYLYSVMDKDIISPIVRDIRLSYDEEQNHTYFRFVDNIEKENQENTLITRFVGFIDASNGKMCEDIYDTSCAVERKLDFDIDDDGLKDHEILLTKYEVLKSQVQEEFSRMETSKPKILSKREKKK